MKVKVDIAKNRLYLKITGELSKNEFEKLYTEVRFCVADMQPNFNVIVDYSASNIIYLNGISTYRKLMNYLIRNGVGRVARVVDEKSLLYKQVTNLSSRICGYKPLYTCNIEAAEKLLDESINRNGLRFYFTAPPVAEYIFNDTKNFGHITNISISGCAIGSASMSPPVDTEITIKMTLSGQNRTMHEFMIKSMVVRMNEDEFAVEFRDFDDDKRNQLLSLLLQETEREI